ncbi:hypothetical protein [Streptomyces antibioticus]|uniref:hypothetical protein n=1 Tax=Streptomyces antibioticus TaxID=1890 RepID=UPI0036F7D496
MHRVTLSSWHDGQAPGTTIEVDDAGLIALRRDGRVAASESSDSGERLLEPTFVETTPTGDVEPVAVPADVEDQAGEPEPDGGDGEPAKGRRRR